MLEVVHVKLCRITKLELGRITKLDLGLEIDVAELRNEHVQRARIRARFRGLRAISIKLDSNITNESFEMMDTRDATTHGDQRIQGILAYFDDNIDKSKASEFLHRLLVSHDILKWNFCGQIVYLAKTIQNTNIVDQSEYCLSPYMT